MAKAYVFGPISFHGPQYLPVYKKSLSLCKKYFDEVIGSYPTFWDSDESHEDYYDRIRKTIVTADLFIGEVSQPSHGVGMEIQMSCDNDIPLVVLAEEGRHVSKMILGLPNLRKIIFYRGLDDLESELEAELETFTGG